MRASFHTLGCKVNQYETEAMKEQFKAAGFDIVSEDDAADVYIINTCTVTGIADRKSRQYIRKMKRVSPDAVVAVCGCYSQVSPEDLMEMPEVDIVTGNGEKEKLIGLVQDVLSGKREKHFSEILPYDRLTEYKENGIIFSMEGRTRAFIKIQEGCDRFCAYCLIPFARGHVRSRNPEEVIREAKALIERGFREIVLTGINTALYGTEAGFTYEPKSDEYDENGMPFTGIELIIKRISEIDGDFRIRLSSLEPTVVNAGYVSRLMKYDRLCHHLHLSIQSGSTDIIKKMNRHYTRDEYLDIVKVLRECDPGYGITTDMIVGFPEETDEDFNDSLKMVSQAEFAKVHAFKYSKRKGTKAASMKNQVPGEAKNSRLDLLKERAEEASASFMESLTGTERIVLFEEFVDGHITGYADNYIKVYADGTEDDLNELIKVKLTEIYKDGMKGEF